MLSYIGNFWKISVQSAIEGVSAKRERYEEI